MLQRGNGFGGHTVNDPPDPRVLHCLVDDPVPALGSQVGDRRVESVDQPQLADAIRFQILDERHALDPGDLTDPGSACHEKFERFLHGHCQRRPAW